MSKKAGFIDSGVVRPMGQETVATGISFAKTDPKRRRYRMPQGT